MDSGASHNLIHRTSIPEGVELIPLEQAIINQTAAGPFSTTHKVRLKSIKLPEFGNLESHSLEAMVFEAPNCAYDVIVGRSWLQPNGFDILFSSGLMQWCGKEVPMKPENQPALFVHSNEDSADMFPTNLMPSSYDAADINKVVEAQTHLTDEQRQKLKAVFKRYPTLFDNRLKKWPHGKVHLEPKEGAEPVHCQPFPVPDATRETFQNEMERLVDVGVLRHVGLSKHAYPTYAIPKKDGRIRIVSDFRRLNAQLKRNIYPLPRIQDLLHRNAKYQWLTKIDLSMYYYHFELDDESKDMCVIITPFGKYGYNRLPMGMLQSSDIAQEAIEWVLRDLDFAAGFIDDIGVRTDNNFDAHLQDLICVLDRLQENNLTVNPLKCEWCVQETDWLGYWLTPSGLKPWKKKIEGMLNVQRPRTLKQLRSFIGAINFYRDMWPHRAKILAPLTAQSGATQFLWTPDMEAAFVQAKSMIATDALLSYPDPTKPYCIQTDASDYQLGAVILQEGKPVAYFSRKLSPAQRNYSTIEKELLSIVETFKEFRPMLFGADLTDHRNLTFDHLSSQRVTRWRLFLEDFNPKLEYLAGDRTVIADWFSRADLMEEKAVDPLDDADLDAFFSLVTQTADCYINMAPNTPNPISYDRVAHAQQLTPGLMQLNIQDPQRYPIYRFGAHDLLCYRAPTRQDFQIYLPDQLLQQVASWYHLVTGHAKLHRLWETVSKHWYNPRLYNTVRHVTSVCQDCQRYTLPLRGVGQLPPRQAIFQPFYEVAVDLIGPWTIKLMNGSDFTFLALTIVDTCTTLSEAIVVENKTAAHVAQCMELSWLHRYPRPVKVIYDRGSEFIGLEFQRMLQLWGIQPVPISTRNPQANAVCERMHLTAGNILRTIVNTNPRPNTYQDAKAMVAYAISMTLHALRITAHSTLRASPGSIVFNRDMLVDVPYVANLLDLRQRRQQLIDYNLRRENNRRRTFDYQPGQRVWEILQGTGKLQPKKRGPYLVIAVHTNGTITIERRPGVTERMNIRLFEPCHP